MKGTLDQSTDQYKAFADPTRLRILNLLGEKELCVCHIVEVLGEPQPKVSRHLAMLRRAGLVTVRVEGPWRHYGLPTERTGLAETLLSSIDSCLGETSELQADRERLARTSTDEGCN